MQSVASLDLLAGLVDFAGQLRGNFAGLCAVAGGKRLLHAFASRQVQRRGQPMPSSPPRDHAIEILLGANELGKLTEVARRQRIGGRVTRQLKVGVEVLFEQTHMDVMRLSFMSSSRNVVGHLTPRPFSDERNTGTMKVAPLFCPGRSARCVLFMLPWASSVPAATHHQRHAPVPRIKTAVPSQFFSSAAVDHRYPSETGRVRHR